MTAGWFARPDGLEAQAREQLKAFTSMLAGVLGIIREVADEARASGRLTR
ncbi:hypothetical protein GCM10020000_82310 [Streptomyces olivoverticillatus]